jgi:hypothetical protein
MGWLSFRSPALCCRIFYFTTSICLILLERKVHLLMALGAGVLVGAAFLDLFASALSAATASGSARLFVFLIAAVGGLLIFYIGGSAVPHSANAAKIKSGQTACT